MNSIFETLAAFTRSYLPSHVPRILKLWKVGAGETIAPMLADPRTYDNLFPGIQDGLKAEKYMSQTSKPLPASQYTSATVSRVN